MRGDDDLLLQGKSTPHPLPITIQSTIAFPSPLPISISHQPMRSQTQVLACDSLIRKTSCATKVHHAHFILIVRLLGLQRQKCINYWDVKDNLMPHPVFVNLTATAPSFTPGTLILIGYHMKSHLKCLPGRPFSSGLGTVVGRALAGLTGTKPWLTPQAPHTMRCGVHDWSLQAQRWGQDQA